MTRFPNLGRLERLLPGAATVLTLSLAVTLRVESSCSDASRPAPQPSPSVLYQNPEILWAEGALTASAYPSEAFLSSAMSSFFIRSSAAIARCAPPGFLSLKNSPMLVGTTCHERP